MTTVLTALLRPVITSSPPRGHFFTEFTNCQLPQVTVLEMFFSAGISRRCFHELVIFRQYGRTNQSDRIVNDWDGKTSFWTVRIAVAQNLTKSWTEQDF